MLWCAHHLLMSAKAASATARASCLRTRANFFATSFIMSLMGTGKARVYS